MSITMLNRCCNKDDEEEEEEEEEEGGCQYTDAVPVSSANTLLKQRGLLPAKVMYVAFVTSN